MTNTAQHLSAERMVELAQGRSTPADQEQARAHLATCAECSTQYARFARVVAVTRQDTSEDVPSHVLARAQRLMRQGKPATPTMRQRIAAALTFDSRLAPAAAGMRAQASATRQILIKAGSYDIDVRIRPSGSRWTVAGQVLGTVGSGDVRLTGATDAQTTLNALQEWTLPPVVAGRYTLALVFDEAEVVVEIDIGA